VKAKSVFGACLAVAILGIGQADAKDVWRGYTYVGGIDQVPYQQMEVMAKTLQSETKGALVIKISPPGSLPIDTQTITQAVGDGILQIADDGFAVGNVPLNGIPRLPLLIKDEAEAKLVLKVLRPYFEKAYAKLGAIVLGDYVYPAQTIWSSAKLTSLADLKGQKIRVTSPEQGEFIKRMGATPVSIGAPDVPSALQTGVVQGLLTASAGGGILWKDQLKYNYRFPVSYFHSLMIVNADAFKRLSPANQDVVRKVLEEGSGTVTVKMRENEDRLTREFAQKGMIVTPVDENDLKQAAKTFADYWDTWGKKQSPEVREALGKVREALKR